MGRIYRFEKVDRFIQLVNDQALTFVLPELWPDRNEGYLFKAAQLPHGIAKIREALRKIRSDLYGLEIALLQAFSQARYAQCWSKCPENDALWKGYEIRIEAERDDISKLDGIEAHDVRYVDYIDLEDELRSLFAYPDEKTVSWKSENVLLIKRAQFSHEQEVRLLTKVVEKNVVNRKPPWVVAAIIEVFRREYQEGKRTKEEFDRLVNEQMISRTKKVSIAHVPNFIRSVMLNPFAPNGVDMKMAHFCAQHSLTYLGKARMYEFNM